MYSPPDLENTDHRKIGSIVMNGEINQTGYPECLKFLTLIPRSANVPAGWKSFPRHRRLVLGLILRQEPHRLLEEV